MKKKWVVVLVAAVAGVAVYAGTVIAASPPVVTATPIAQATFAPLDLMANAFPHQHWRAKIKTDGNSDVYITDNKLDPGAATGWHTHPGPSLVLVIAGTVTNYSSEDCAGESYSAGSGFTDPGGTDVHMLKNNGSTEAETVAVQIVAQGAARKTPEPEPSNCASG